MQQNQDYDNDEIHEDDEGEKDQDFFKDGKLTQEYKTVIKPLEIAYM